MIKVILPRFNQKLLNDLPSAVLEDVCSLVFSSTEYTTEYEDRRNGRYVKIVDDNNNEIHYVCFSNPSNDSRNAHLMQFVSPTYVDFDRDTSKNKKLDIYLINQSSNDRTDYIKMFYRCFVTLDITILNLQGLSGIVPFNSYEDLKSYRNQTSGRNTHNRSTYFTDDDNQVSIFGKTFGANAMESFIFGLTIRRIVEKQVVFYPVVDNETENISAEQQRILTEAGIGHGDFIRLLPTGYARATRDSSRNQSVFKYNLLQKFGDQQCYLCGCDVEHLIIASHIERVTDIDSSALYTPDQKAERATDGDNGLWLCASHDKMFEYGIIYFEGKELKIGSFVINEQQKRFIQKSIFEMRKVYFNDIAGSTFNIQTEHHTNKMRQYITKHLERHKMAMY